VTAPNLVWQQGLVSRDDRARARGHRGVALWLTGYSGSGKSSLASRTERALVARGVAAYVLDGDNIRHGLCKDLGFAPADRAENVRRVAEAARLFVDAGLVVLTALVSPYRGDRDAARALFAPGDFVELWVSTPLAVCEARDKKGLYARARRGEIKDMTGVDAPYEPPLKAELTIDASEGDPEAKAAEVVAFLAERGYIAP
jgi:adenylyl-sulfate kinase